MSKCAFDRGDECSALTVKECDMCSFCKSREELERGRVKASNRIRSLSVDKYVRILHKYYVDNKNGY